MKHILLCRYNRIEKIWEEVNLKENEFRRNIWKSKKGIIVEQLGVTENTVTMEASFIDDLGADSLDIVELIMALEEEFDLEIPDADAEKIVTVSDVVDYIKENWSIEEKSFKKSSNMKSRFLTIVFFVRMQVLKIILSSIWILDRA